jgi:hypothetical protein
MAAGGDGFTMFLRGRNLSDTGIPVRTILMNAIQKHDVINFLGDDRWKVAPVKAYRQNAA